MSKRNLAFAAVAAFVVGLAAFVVELLTITPKTDIVSAAAELREIEFPVAGMDCGGCSAAVNYVLSPIDGVVEFKADHDRQLAWVRYDGARVTPQKIVETINEKTPFRASLPER
jgi:copper chaperone CopZ